jgi:isocitrate dehydrogenase
VFFTSRGIDEYIEKIFDRVINKKVDNVYVGKNEIPWQEFDGIIDENTINV